MLEISTLADIVAVKTSEKIIAAISERADVTIADLAEAIGVTPRTIERHLKNLQKKEYIRRVGPDKGGHWEVLDAD